MNDRTIGYIVIAALVIFLLTPVSFLIFKFKSPEHVRVIEFRPFNSIDFLNIEDAVRCRGVKSGQIRSITHVGPKVFVTIESDSTLILYRDYKITATMKGLLGERYLEINPGSSNLEIVSQKDTLTGSFIIGAAEIVAYVGKIRTLLNDITITSQKLKDGYAENLSIVKKFSDAVSMFDSVSSTIIDVSKKLDTDLTSNFDTLSDLIKLGNTYLETASEDLPQILNRAEKTFVQIEEVLVKTNTFIVQADSTLQKIQDPKVILWKNDIKELQNSLDSITKIFQSLKSEGLRLPVKLHQRKSN